MHGTVSILRAPNSNPVSSNTAPPPHGKIRRSEQSPAAIGLRHRPVEVSAKLIGLTGHTTYHYRLHAVNSKGKVFSEDETFLTLLAPLIDEAKATNLSATGATLTAKINPDGLSTTYHFEYDTTPYSPGEAPHGTEVPLEGEEIGNATSDQEVSQPIEGLSADTTYYFRVIASNSNGITTGASHAFVDLTHGAPIAQSCENEALRTKTTPRPARLPRL